MKIITQRDLILTVVERWKANTVQGADRKAILENLKKLDLNVCSSKDIADIIGNESWTDLQCDECEMNVDLIIQVGQGRDYDTSMAYLCRRCVENAFLNIESRGRPVNELNEEELKIANKYFLEWSDSCISADGKVYFPTVQECFGGGWVHSKKHEALKDTEK